MRRAVVLSVVLSLLALPATAAWEEGVAAFKKGDFQTAQAEFKELVDQAPEGWQGHYMLALTLQRLKQRDAALEHLRRAYDLNPNEASVKSELGRAYYTNKRYAEAAKILNSVDPSSMPANQRSGFYQIRGDALLRAGNTDAAAADLSKLAKLEPNNSDVQFKYGVVALRAGDTEAAILALDRAVRADASDLDKKKAYAQALIKKARTTRDKTVKKTSYLKAAELAAGVVAGNGSAENLMLQLSAQLGAGQYAEAAATGEEAMKKSPRDWLAAYYTGQAYTSAGIFEKAEAPLRKALELASASDQQKVWKQLGYTFEKQKAYAESIQAYQNAGDSSGVARVKKNEETARYNQQVEAENEQIRAMQEEAERLEEELKKLEEGGGGR
ncbi:MAG: tetratricopeptide repeat protein [Acidobacteriota bacterium]